MRVIFTLIIFCCFITPAFSQGLEDRPHTLLWAVVNAKGDTSYLFGTFHEFGVDYVKKYPQIKKKMRAADEVFLEGVPEGQATVQKVDKWTKYLSGAEYKALNNYLKNVGDGMIGQYKKLPANELKYLLLSEVYAKACKTRENIGDAKLEEYIYVDRQYLKKKVSGLETRNAVGSTMEFVSGEAGSSDSLIVRHIVDIIEHEQKYMDSVHVLKQCDEAEQYKNADIDYRFSIRSTDEDPEFSYALDERNMNWLPAIRQSVDKQKTFVAVGMKHLWYQKGLINLLLGAGYRVFPVAMK